MKNIKHSNVCAFTAGSVFKASLLGAVFMTSTMTAFAQGSGPIKIGMIFPKQGPSASIGEYLSRGAMLAVEQRGGKVMGRDIEIVFLDEPSAQQAQQNFQKLVDEHGVVGVVGGNSSAAALAMMSVANRTKTPLVVAGAAAREVTGANCNPYTFRFQATVPVQMAGLMPMVKKEGENVYFITAAYAFGQDILNTGRDMLKGNGKEVGVDEVPLNTADYSSYVLKIRSKKPDAVVGGLVGQDLSSFLKTWNAMGMKGKIPFYEIAVSDTDFWDVGVAASTGVYAKPWYYNDPNNAAGDKEFSKLFTEKYGRPPADKAYSGWLTMRSLLDAIENAKSTEAKDIVKALESWKDDKGAFPAYYRDWDHQLIRPSVIVKVKDQITDKWDFFNVLAHTSQNQEDTLADFGTREEVGCKMAAL